MPGAETTPSPHPPHGLEATACPTTAWATGAGAAFARIRAMIPGFGGTAAFAFIQSTSVACCPPHGLHGVLAAEYTTGAGAYAAGALPHPTHPAPVLTTRGVDAATGGGGVSAPAISPESKKQVAFTSFNLLWNSACVRK